MRFNRYGILMLGVLLTLGVILACGGAAEPAAAPVKEAPKAPAAEAPKAKAPKAEAPKAEATKAPAVEKMVPAGTVVAATRNLRSGSGTPMFCTPPCAENIYLLAITETLTGVKSGPGGPLDPQNTPMLAESWEVAPDLSYMDFKLRKGVKFHKGWGEMTAEDVAFSFNNANSATNPDSIHGQAGDFAPLIKNVEALDPHTARVNFKLFYVGMPLRYFGPFYQSAGIMPKAVFEKHGPEEMRGIFIGTGPFEFVQWKKDEVLEAEAVTEHWRKVPNVKTVKILDFPENATRVAAFETGEAQVAGELPYKDVVRLQEKGFKVNRDSGRTLEDSLFFTGNYWEAKHPQTGAALSRTIVDKPWIGKFGDDASMERARKVRWALALTIDRESIARNILSGLGEVCYMNQLSINQPGWKEKWIIPFDPEKARQLIKEAGYPDGFEVDMWVGPGGLNVELGDALAGLWLKELNVKTNLDRITYTKFRPGLVQRTSTAIYMSAGDEGKSGFPAHWPKGFQGSAWTDGGWGPGFEVPFYSEIFSRMNSELDDSKRLAMSEEFYDHAYHWMTQPCIDESPSYPMYNPEQVAEWPLNPNMNGNLSWTSNYEYMVLAK